MKRSGLIPLIIKLGLLTVAGTGAVLWLAVQIGGLNGPAGPLRDTYAVTADFSDATGLVPGDQVRMSGVAVGKVGSIAVERGKAEVRLAVDDRYELPRDARFELHWRNLLGQRYVQVVPPEGAEAGGPVLADGARIPADRTASAADLSTLINNTEPLLANLDTAALNRVMTTLAAALQGREDELGRAIDGSAQLVDALAGRAQAIDSSIHSMAVLLDQIGGHDEQVRTLLASLGTTAQTLAARSGELDQVVTGTEQLTGTLERVLAATTRHLDTFFDQAAQVSATLAENKAALSEGVRTLPWTAAALLRATNHGDWINIYGRGFGVVNAFVPEPRIGPDYSDVGPDDEKGPEPLLGQPRVPLPAIPPTGAGPVQVNPPPGAEPSSGLEFLLGAIQGPAAR